MASVNKVIIMGNLGKDPELRYSPNGTAFCSITVATSRSWKDKQSGEKKEETEWHKVMFNDKLAEIVGQYCTKGKPIYVEGRLKTRKWQNKDGVDQYTTEIIADQMQLLGTKDETKPEARPASRPAAQPAPQRKPATAGAAANYGSAGPDWPEEDLPF